MTLTTTDLEALRTAPLTPGSPEWLTVMTASKVPAMLGLSEYDSPFSLWHRMNGTVPSTPTTPVMDRGHYAELMLAAWFADQHPDLIVGPTATYVRDGWMGANPDRVILTRDGRHVAGLLQIKASSKGWEWGDPGTDEVPDKVAAQVQWEMAVTGATQCWVARDTGWELTEYLVTHDPDDAAFLTTRARDFMASIDAGIAPSVDDGHAETYQAIRHLHPDITDTTVDITDTTAQAVHDYLAHKATTTELEHRARTALAADMGTARVAQYHRTTYATRQSRGDGTPYVVLARGLTHQEHA